MKRVFASLIIVIFLFNMMGYYFVFSYNQHFVRNEMKGLIKSGYFEGLSIALKISNPASNNDFRRVSKGEFEYKGMLYDIVSEKKEGNFTIFRCINDKNEEKLLAGFHQYFELSYSQNNPVKAKHALALLYHVIKLALLDNHWNQSPVVPIEISFLNPILPLSSIFYPPDFPPPKFA
jgi:hypothetical protein